MGYPGYPTKNSLSHWGTASPWASQVLLAMSFYALELCPNCELAGGLIKVRLKGLGSSIFWVTLEDFFLILFMKNLRKLMP